MATSNSVFLNVRETPPLDGVGWVVKVLSYKDFQTQVATLDHYKKLTVNCELNQEGSGSLEFSMEDSFWDTYLWSGITARDILKNDYLFQAWEDGVLRFEFIGAQIRESIVNRNEEQTVTISGPGTAEVLKWAVVLPPNFPKHKSGVIWDTLKTPAMKFAYMLVRAAQKRGTIPWVKMNFDGAKDSNGKEWPDLKVQRAFKIDYGESLFDILNKATGQDPSDPWSVRADWYMRPGFHLDVRQTFGARLDNKVIFFEGDIEEKSHSRSRDKIANYVAVYDDKAEYFIAADTASIKSYHKREYVERNAALQDQVKRANTIVNVMLQQRKDEESEWTLSVPYDRVTRRPFRDYGVGDWVGVSRYGRNGAPSTVEPHRVLGIAIQVDDTDTTVELTMESLYQVKQRNLERLLTKLLHDPLTNKIKVPNPYKVPADVPMPVIWNPKTGFSADPNYSLGGGGGSGVFIQATDPALNTANNVHTGALWLDTSI